MLTTIIGILSATWALMIEMAPFLIFGFFIAGILHLVIPSEKIYQHLSGNSLGSIIKASIFGVPLPLCSCGVIPVAAYLRKEGAGKSSTISFLSSTPTTGVDSILATYSLLGPLFAIIRPVAAFFAGIMSGSLVGIFQKKIEVENIKQPVGKTCTLCNINEAHSHTLLEKIKYIFHYGFVELIEDSGKWILIGVFAGGLISFLIPDNFFAKYLSNPLYAYPLMLVISIPMYVCATGSIPIAAALILKGMTPGAGLIFLIAGPASNTATLSFVSGKLGKRTLVFFLIAIVVTALIFGFLVDYIWKLSGDDFNLIDSSMTMLPTWMNITAAIILAILIMKAISKNLINKYIKKDKEVLDMKANYLVNDMSCQHCVNSIKSSLKPIEGIEKININLEKKLVQVDGEFDEKKVINAINQAGYSVEKEE